MNEPAHDVLWRRMKYMLTPQWDIYHSLKERLMGSSVLEVGFGTGAGVLQYAAGANYVEALEIDPGAVHFAKSMWCMTNVVWKEQDITEYTCDPLFDFAVMIETLEHIKDYRMALRKIRNALKPGGYLIMSSRNANADLRRWKDLHEREWTSEQLLAALSEWFKSAYLYDYGLTERQTTTTKLTPLIAIAKKDPL